MKTKIRALLLVSILFLSIGFAAISVNLIIKGSIPVLGEFNELDIFFSRVIVDGVDVSDDSIIKTRRTFTFDANLNEEKNAHVISYTLANNTKDLDVIVGLECTPDDSNNISINIPEDKIISAKETINDEISVNLLQTNSTENISCTIVLKEKANTSKENVDDTVCLFDAGMKWTYEYTGSEQLFMVPCDGNYKIELWGARGGYAKCDNELNCGIPGNGGYTSGEIELNSKTKLYAYVGSKGEDASSKNDYIGGYNGGGIGTWNHDTENSEENAYKGAGAGGGATDIRLENGAWNSFESLKSRIMVAGGGAGTSWNDTSGSAGGLESYSFNPDALIATQISGYKFGVGEDGNSNGEGDDGCSGGGGGYFGGGASSTYLKDNYHESAAGGSSYISGHNGCIAVDVSSTDNNIIFKDNANHYSDLIFKKTSMIDGQGYAWSSIKGEQTGMPSIKGNETVNGNAGDGFVKITLISKN